MIKKTILCVEDEPLVLLNNRLALEDNGYNVLTAATLSAAWTVIKKQSPDAIILDIMLPDGLGIDLLKKLREQGNQVPVMLLTAWGKPTDVARGLRAGANDYLSKPFEYEVLLARIETMFRNIEQVPERIKCGSLTLDPISGRAFLNGDDLMLTQKDFSLLLLLIQNVERTISTEYIYESVWGQKYFDGKRALENAVSRLRKSLFNSGFEIMAKRNKGYCLHSERKAPKS